MVERGYRYEFDGAESLETMVQRAGIWGGSPTTKKAVSIYPISKDMGGKIL